MAKTTNPMSCVWLGTTGDRHTAITITGHGDVLLGSGPGQSTSVGEVTTIGTLRLAWGDPSLAPYLHGECPCSVHTVYGNTIVMVPQAGLRDYTNLPGEEVGYPAHMPEPAGLPVR